MTETGRTTTTRRTVLRTAAAAPLLAVPFVRAAEAQAKSGHDIMQLTAWYAPGHAASLEPVDDVMAQLIQQHGAINAGAEYLGKQDGHWIAVPTSYGSTLSPPCARIDLMKQIVGLDITKMYPAGAP